MTLEVPPQIRKTGANVLQARGRSLIVSYAYRWQPRRSSPLSGSASIWEEVLEGTATYEQDGKNSTLSPIANLWGIA